MTFWSRHIGVGRSVLFCSRPGERERERERERKREKEKSQWTQKLTDILTKMNDQVRKKI
jgi:hypothetical protein